MKKGIVLLLLLATLLMGCTAPADAPEAAPTDEMIEMTLEEVAAYNGEAGRQAYVVVDGTIYDVSEHPQWATGSHGGNLAGSDITEMLDTNAAHGRSKLEEVVAIGTIVSP